MPRIVVCGTSVLGGQNLVWLPGHISPCLSAWHSSGCAFVQKNAKRVLCEKMGLNVTIRSFFCLLQVIRTSNKTCAGERLRDETI